MPQINPPDIANEKKQIDPFVGAMFNVCDSLAELAEYAMRKNLVTEDNGADYLEDMLDAAKKARKAYEDWRNR